MAIYKGIKLRELKYKATIPPSKIDLFVQKCCKIGPIYRIDGKSLELAYAEFDGKKVSKIELDELREYIGEQFLPGCWYQGDIALNGFWGITLKNDDSKTGLKISTALRKQVICTNLETKEVQTFDSLVETAKHFNAGPSAISTDIKYKRIRNGHLLTYEKLDKIPGSSTKK